MIGTSRQLVGVDPKRYLTEAARRAIAEQRPQVHGLARLVEGAVRVKDDRVGGAKPDRHLVRIAGALGARSVDHLCRPLAEFSGDPVSVVDLVLWRFATLRTDYVELMRHWRSMSFDVD